MLKTKDNVDTENSSAVEQEGSRKMKRKGVKKW